MCAPNRFHWAISDLSSWRCIQLPFCNLYLFESIHNCNFHQFSKHIRPMHCRMFLQVVLLDMDLFNFYSNKILPWISNRNYVGDIFECWRQKWSNQAWVKSCNISRGFYWNPLTEKLMQYQLKIALAAFYLTDLKCNLWCFYFDM